MASAGKGEGSGRILLQVAVLAMVGLVAVGLMMNPGTPWSPTRQPVRHITVTTFDPDPKQGVAPEQEARKERSIARLGGARRSVDRGVAGHPQRGWPSAPHARRAGAPCVAAMLSTLKATPLQPTPVADPVKGWSAMELSRQGADLRDHARAVAGRAG